MKLKRYFIINEEEDKIEYLRAKIFDHCDKLFYNFDYAIRSGIDSALQKLVRDGNISPELTAPVENAIVELGHAIIALEKVIMRPEENNV